MGVKYVKNIKINLPYDQVFNLCKDSINKIEKSKIKDESYEKGEILAQTGMSWKTFGDRIVFYVKKIDNNQSEVRIMSQPLLTFTMIDYGKNRQNIEKIITFLEEKIKNQNMVKK